MADYRRYQPRRSSGSLPWRPIVFGALGLIAVILLYRQLFTSNDTANSNTNTDDEIRLVTDNSNQSEDTNTDVETNSNANVNASVELPPDTSTFSLDNCSEAISSFGSAKQVALTFNVAAANEELDALIEVLKTAKVPATFFVSGALAEANGDAIKRLSEAGFGVYNRTQSNPHLPTLSAEEIAKQLSDADTAITAATGQSSKPFLRPPFGDVDDDVVATAKSEGYCTILWTVDAFDWQSDATAQSSRQRVLDKLAGGAIIMFSAGYDVTAEAVRLVAADLKKQGYTAVTLVSLLTPQ